MKQKLFILGLAVVLVTITGVIFKTNHFPGAAILMTAGISTLLFIFLPAALSNHYKNYGTRQTKALYIVTWVTCLVVFSSMLFKVLHWPGAGILLLIALPFPFVIFLPVYLYVTSRIKNYDFYNTIYVLFLLAGFSVLSGLLGLNISKNRISDTIVLSNHYNRLDKSLGKADEFFTVETRSPVYFEVLATIDSTLKLIDDCQDRLLDIAGMTPEQWAVNPVVTNKFDSRQAVRNVMLRGKNPVPGLRLQNNLEIIVNGYRQMIQYGDIASLAPLLLGYGEPGYTGSQWRSVMFENNHLSWALTYLESLKVNLKLLRLNAALKSY